MKANEFVKKFGWEYSKHILNEDSVILVDLDYTHLKRLIESHELVKEHGSLERAKMYAESMYTAPEVVERMKQAVADVESCQ